MNPETEMPKEQEVPETAAPAEDTASKLEAEVADLKDQLLRSMADYENFRRRTAREKEELAAFARAECLKPLLDVADNFERAMAAQCTDEEFKKGMTLIHQQFTDTLTRLGVTRIEAMGQPFDPTLHNAIQRIESEEFGENTVCQVVQNGYRMGDRVIRHAMVIVANS